MPIYEYQCRACGKELEVLQKISDATLQDCPDCGESSLRKKVSAAAFRLKGGGWYETDFKTGDKKNLAGDGDSAAAKPAGDKPGSSGEGKKTESKQASGNKPEGKKTA